MDRTSFDRKLTGYIIAVGLTSALVLTCTVGTAALQIADTAQQALDVYRDEVSPAAGRDATDRSARHGNADCVGADAVAGRNSADDRRDQTQQVQAVFHRDQLPDAGSQHKPHRGIEHAGSDIHAHRFTPAFTTEQLSAVTEVR